MTTLLLVDDRPNQQMLCRMELEDEGYQVVLASGGRQALQRLEDAGIHLVVLDLGMPDMDGFELLTRMRELDARLPVIIPSGYDTREAANRTWMADAYVVKSSNLDRLKTEVARVLFGRQDR